MDYKGMPIPEGRLFTVQEGDKLWMSGEGEIEISEKRVREIQLSPTWTTTAISYGGTRTHAVEHKCLQVPHDKSLVWTTRRGQISVFLVRPDSDIALVKKVEYRPSYELLGTAVIHGHKHTDIGPLHLPGLRGGRIQLEITDAIHTFGEEYGTLCLQSSPDGEHWFDLPFGGLSKNTMRIEQRGLFTGDIYGDELYLTNHGEYIRVHYLPKRIAGWGFKGTVHIETSR